MSSVADTPTDQPDVQGAAEDFAARLWENDTASKGLGMEILGVGPGRAVVSMKIRLDMVNTHAIAHGGFITALADALSVTRRAAAVQ